MTDCSSPISWETLVDYWAGDLSEESSSVVEEHLMGCAACSDTAARVADTAEALRTMIPMVVRPEKLRRLSDTGLQVVENPIAPGEVCTFHYPPSADVVVHRLGGLELRRPGLQVSLTLRVEGTGEILNSIDDAPFDAAEGAVLLACQRHYSRFPHDLVAELCVRDPSGRERRTEYIIRHHFPD